MALKINAIQPVIGKVGGWHCGKVVPEAKENVEYQTRNIEYRTRNFELRNRFLPSGLRQGFDGQVAGMTPLEWTTL
jgi:hypothetical protein